MEKQKAVLYCRVARLSDEEKEIQNQAARFKELFGFEPTEIYTDIGKSGRDNNRPEYRRLIDDALSGKIDYIAVKCLAKFNRDMAATIEVLRQLCDKGVGVCMMNEDMDVLKQSPMVYGTLIEMLERADKWHKGGQTMVEYKIGETAHVNRRITVKAQKYNIIKSLTIATDAAVDIIAVRKSTDAFAIKATGGAVYDILYDGYKIDSVPQKDLYSKSQWTKISEMLAKLKKQ